MTVVQQPSDLLTDQHRRELDESGYTVLRQLMSRAEIVAVKTSLMRIGNIEGKMAGYEYTLCDDGAFRLHNLLNKDTVYDTCLTHPAVLAAIRHVLGDDIRLSMLNMRSQLPGQKRQKLHVDWYDGPAPNGDYKVCNAIWALDDFTEANGATRVVPGSHRFTEVPKQAMADQYDSWQGETRILAEAGDVIVFNSHLWHSGMDNATDRPRAGINAFFCRADQKPEMNQEELLGEDARDRLSPWAQELLGLR
ncbi:hypothetical protein Cs7R123_48640 [Catellatospora sp. TT07R-123]|uniref:phytanoyl-CoA dioxygenase family protein n=1 Tax=Catellatospora sp. TT07R-123 TaxID=2733863 RepID=UPI001AFFB50C|nr:phytanoyl-CoA dioxygenase family protein [Catellatospora sp. TT07R-123]GHJ47522.1 hypothetical protein Cs7R123_48640 [Catellatospora sp. TT07R-123]